MSNEVQQHPVTKQVVVYKMENTDSVRVQQDVVYQTKGNEILTMDLYYPGDSSSVFPAVLIVAGYPDLGFEKHAGCKFKEMGSSISWAKLIAASGMIAITYTNRNPETDIQTILQYIKLNAERFGVDTNRIGLWASSGNVPLALSLLINKRSEAFKCAVFCYGYMLDLNGATHVSDASRMFGFAHPNVGKSIEDLPVDTPLFIVKASQDQCPHLNETLDRFMIHALSRNLTITFVNHPDAPHAFDLVDDSKRTHRIIKQILSFMQFQLKE